MRRHSSRGVLPVRPARMPRTVQFFPLSFLPSRFATPFCKELYTKLYYVLSRYVFCVTGAVNDARPRGYGVCGVRWLFVCTAHTGTVLLHNPRTNHLPSKHEYVLARFGEETILLTT